jgi:RNA polymerase sigma factor (sigma-70 family)
MAGISLQIFIRRLCRGRGVALAGGLTDADLLERFATQRDEMAFEVLVWRHGGLVLGVCQRLLRQPCDVEDVFQATFLTLARKARSIRRREALGSWLHRVAYRMALRLRKSITQQERDQTSAGEPRIAIEEEDPTRRELRTALDDEVSCLPPRYRTAVVLCYLQGMTTHEAARLLGCPQGTVLSRLAWARQRLRNRLIRRGLAPGAALGTLPILESASASPSPTLVQDVVRAALPYAAGRTTVLSPQVALLTQGALQAMWLSKIKLVIAFVVVAGAIGMAGTSVGWRLLARASANSPPAAEEAETKQTPRRDEAQERERLRKARILLAEEDLQKAENEADKIEDQLTEQMIQARVRLIQLEMQLRTIEREHQDQREEEVKEIKGHKASVAYQDVQMSGIRERVKKGEDVPTLKRTEEVLTRSRERLRKKEAEFAAAEEKHMKEYLQLRKEIITEEERVKSIERQQIRRRDKAAVRREAAADRLRQLEIEPAAVDGSERRLDQLERTLERLRRELSELRRELRESRRQDK